MLNGPGPVPPYPPARSRAVATTLRTVFLTLTVISCGYLSSLPLLHLAVRRRRVKDWLLFSLSAALTVASFVTVNILPASNPWTDAAVLAVMVLIPVAGVYYLLADLAWHRAAAPHPPYAPTVPLPHRPGLPQPPADHDPYRTPPPAAPPLTPPPPRISQVRAELDELSELLRKQEGGR